MAEIAVVIPAFNAARFIEATVASVATQDLSDIEIVIVDDGSADATPRLIEALAKEDVRILTVTQANGGVSAARNAGLAAAAPEATSVLFLDHDDLLLPGALTHLSQRLAADRGLSAVQGRVRIVREDGEPCPDSVARPYEFARRRLPPGGIVAAIRTGPVATPDSDPTTFDALVYTNSILTPGQVLVRRSALRDAGPFDPQTAPSDDWEFYLRLSRAGPIGYLDEPVLAWRLHERNASHDADRMQASSLAVRRKLLRADPRLTREQRKAVRRQFGYTAAALAAAAARRDPACDLHADLMPALRLFAATAFMRARR